MRWTPITVLIASGLHLTWSAGLLLDPASQNATAIHALMLLTDSARWAGLILLVVALLALGGAFLHIHQRVARIFLMLPQQVILIMSSVAALSAMAARSFADGVQRPFWFIVVDQIPVILIAAGYLLSLSRMIAEGKDVEYTRRA